MIKDYEDILKRCKKQGIDTSNCDIYIYPNNLNGQYCFAGTLSHDGIWICIPERDEAASAFSGEDVYVPICYEVAGSYNTYLKGDTLSYLVDFYLLYKRKE